MADRVKEYLDAVDRHAGKHYNRKRDAIFKDGKGIRVRSTDGREWIDVCMAYSAGISGHNHPRIKKAFEDFWRSDVDGWGPLAALSNKYITVNFAEFHEAAGEYFPLYLDVTKNSGAEGVECAIKVARKWGYTKKGVPQDKAVIGACENNFHGRTTGVISFSSEPKYRDDFGPYAPNAFKLIPFNDLAALEKLLSEDRNIVMFLVEPIQGEGGLNVPAAGYLKQAQGICKKYNVIFCVDEVQTGLGRTGKLLASFHDDVIPDMVILGKAIGAGYVASSLLLAREEFMVFVPGDDGSTYGGNPLAMYIGKEVFKMIKEENLCEKAEKMGRYLLSELTDALSNSTRARGKVSSIRGKGLLIGIELVKSAKFSPEDAEEALFRSGIMTTNTRHVFRFSPSLFICRRECDEVVARTVNAFESF